MKKLIIIVSSLILGLLLVTYVISFFLPSAYNVSQSIEISKPVDQIFSQVADYRQWTHWSPWQAMESEAKYEISGPLAQPGAQMQWTGNKVGSGSMRLMSVEHNKNLESHIDFFEPQEGSATDRWDFESVSAQSTKVSWTNSGPLTSPAAKWVHVLFLKRFMNATLADGLRRLKTHCESTKPIGP